jgi:LysM repeat protein
VPSGTALKKVASQYGISLEALLEFNELKPADKLIDNQVIF